MNAIRFIKSLFAWRHVGNKGAWRYLENIVTGERSAHRVGPYGPQDIHWLTCGRADLSSDAPRPRVPSPRLRTVE
jgi:hypothetical protein